MRKPNLEASLTVSRAHISRGDVLLVGLHHERSAGFGGSPDSPSVVVYKSALRTYMQASSTARQVGAELFVYLLRLCDYILQL